MHKALLSHQDFCVAVIVYAYCRRIFPIFLPLNEQPYKHILKASKSVVLPVPFFPPKIIMGLDSSIDFIGCKSNDCSPEKTPKFAISSRLNLMQVPPELYRQQFLYF